MRCKGFKGLDAEFLIHKKKWRVSQSDEYLRRYKEIDEHGKRYYWDTLARDGLQNPIVIKIDCPDGTQITVNSQKSKETILEGLNNGTIRFTKGKNGWTLHHRVYMPEGQVFRSILDNVGTNKTAGEEMKALFGDAKAFDYPKPESLIKVLIELCSNEGDLILDSFLGSGTTAAVAHKMGRRWIGIELGDHCYTHCLPRLKAVVDGEQGGISKTVNWKGGGGFRFFELAPSLLKKDKYGNWVIDERYNADMLAAAMAKHQGFAYAPDSEVFWKQGYSYEKDYIFTTTQFVTLEYLDLIHQEMAEDESLLICCKAFQDGADQRYDNINIKKIPLVLLNKCDFGVENYSMNIVDLPKMDEEADDNE
ncbi:MAG: site-specific DNA-methyltransferase [Clostridiales bacterium]|nr:site-specific DNA-methyltransferase [Clostridiales bacterium]